MNLPFFIRAKTITSAPATPEKIHVYKTGKMAGQIRRTKEKPARSGLLPITEKTLWSWVKQGKFPTPYRLNGATVWKTTEVFEWLESKQ
ncbi:helix-turn-helix domain-containing protein [Acinetobacter baumannii]|nr:helix-turn-helix domain-containing protein [Acinetobacter baumannii]